MIRPDAHYPEALDVRLESLPTASIGFRMTALRPNASFKVRSTSFHPPRARHRKRLPANQPST